MEQEPKEETAFVRRLDFPVSVSPRKNALYAEDTEYWHELVVGRLPEKFG
jgi:hypothetical protein